MEVAAVLAAGQRPGDVAGRLGGEEFALLLPGAAAPDAAQVAERLRAQVEALAIEWRGRRIAVTVSFGCAAWPGAAPDAREPVAAALQALIQEADTALYEAKAGGRNRTVVRAGRAPGATPEHGDGPPGRRC